MSSRPKIGGKPSLKKVMLQGKLMYHELEVKERQLNYMIAQLYMYKSDHEVFIKHPENVPFCNKCQCLQSCDGKLTCSHISMEFTPEKGEADTEFKHDVKEQYVPLVLKEKGWEGWYGRPQECCLAGHFIPVAESTGLRLADVDLPDAPDAK